MTPTPKNGRAAVYEHLGRLLPVVVSVAIGAAATYKSLEGMLSRNTQEIERLRHALEKHDSGFGHDGWFGGGGIRHPALRGAIERHHRECSEREHAGLQTRAECRDIWYQFFSLNRDYDFEKPTPLRRP